MLTVESCTAVRDVIDDAITALPADARAVRAQLKTIRAEHHRAIKNYQHALELELRAVIVPIGGVERGELIVLGAGPCPVRRMSDTGVEVQHDGMWTWENISSRATPVVVAEGVR